MSVIIPLRCAEPEALSIIEATMMQINVPQLLKEPIGSKGDYKISGVVDITGEGDGASVDGEVLLTRTNRSILVEGALRVVVELECARCLNLFSHPLLLNIKDEFFSLNDLPGGAPLTPAQDEPGGFTISSNQVLDLTEAVRQYAVMAIPMKPLCSQDCTGV